MVAACPDAVVTDPSFLYGMIPSDLQTADPGGDRALAENLRWRPAQTAK